MGLEERYFHSLKSDGRLRSKRKGKTHFSAQRRVNSSVSQGLDVRLVSLNIFISDLERAADSKIPKFMETSSQMVH